ncbi:MAG: hypothetical protein K5928_01005 [Prevotella sp.]|nr:hypothetical protein [Prevotella sp.]
MKKIFMLLVAALTFTGVKAAENVIWEDTYVDGIEISSTTIATFEAGDVLRVYITVPESGGNFKICFKGEPDWSETAIPSIDNQWPWVNAGETYKDFTLTQDDLTAMTGKNIYIYQGENSVITKITLITNDSEPEPVEGEQIVWEGNQPISWNTEVAPGIQFETTEGTFDGLKKNDIIKFYTTTTYEEPQYVVTYKKGDGWEWTDLETTVADGIISYTVTDEITATEISERGLILRGQAYTLTKITVTKENPTTINDHRVSQAVADKKTYNLQGMEVKGVSLKGIYVRNGKKCVIK